MVRSRKMLFATLAGGAALSCAGASGNDGGAGSSAAGAGGLAGAATQSAGSESGGALTASAGAVNATAGDTAAANAGAASGGAGGALAAGGFSNIATGGTGGTTSGGAANGGGAGAGAGAGQSNSGGTTGAAGSSGYSPCPATGTPCVILPFGDSITYGFGSSDAGGYRSQLFALIVAAKQSATFVGSSSDGPDQVAGKPFPKQHEGHPSYTIDDYKSLKGITPFVDQGLIKTYKPNIVLLMIGTNDMANSVDLPNAPSRLGKLIDKIIADAPSALVVVAKITPSRKAPANASTQTYNSAITGVVSQRTAQGKHVRVVDMYAPFMATADYTKLMHDSVHPNDAGYVILANTWYPAIRDVLR